jgi:hypothetical protein
VNKWAAVALLWLVCFFNYADRQAIFSVFPLLEREMRLTSFQLGLLGSGFAYLVYFRLLRSGNNISKDQVVTLEAAGPPDKKD